jgi:hypothetical protein
MADAAPPSYLSTMKRAFCIVATVTLALAGTVWTSGARAQTLPTVLVGPAADGLILVTFEGGPTTCGDNTGGPGVRTDTIERDVSFELTLSGEITEPLNVNLAWGGSAIAGLDYHPPTAVTFTPLAAKIIVAAAITPTAGNKTIELTVVAGSGHTVGSPPETAFVQQVFPDPLFCPPPPPVTNPPFTG